MDFLTLIIALISSGTVTGLIMYAINKRNADLVTDITVDKALAEIRSIQQTIEANYVEQLRVWIKDLQEVEVKHKLELNRKDEELVEVHKTYLETLRQLTESRLHLDNQNKATQNLMSQLDIPYWESDPTGKITHINNAWADLFGINPAYENWVDTIIPEERQRLNLLWQISMLDLKSKPLKFHLVPVGKDHPIPIRFVYSHIHDEEGNLVKVIGVVIKLRVE